MHKETHTIGDRKFINVEIGDVDHHAVKVKTAIKGTHDMHTMAQKVGGDALELEYGELTCTCLPCMRKYTRGARTSPRS